MTRQELILELNKQTSRQPTALVMDQHGDKGIAMILFKNMSHPWNSGDLIIFWANGDHTDYGWPQCQDHKLPKLKWCHRVRTTEVARESTTVVAAVGTGDKWKTRRYGEFSTYPRSQQPPCGNQCTCAGVR